MCASEGVEGQGQAITDASHNGGRLNGRKINKVRYALKLLSDKST